MKKFIIAMLCVAVLFGFAACDNSNSNAPAGGDEPTAGLSDYQISGVAAQIKNLLENSGSKIAINGIFTTDELLDSANENAPVEGVTISDDYTTISKTINLEDGVAGFSADTEVVFTIYGVDITPDTTKSGTKTINLEKYTYEFSAPSQDANGDNVVLSGEISGYSVGGVVSVVLDAEGKATSVKVSTVPTKVLLPETDAGISATLGDETVDAAKLFAILTSANGTPSTAESYADYRATLISDDASCYMNEINEFAATLFGTSDSAIAKLATLVTSKPAGFSGVYTGASTSGSATFTYTVPADTADVSISGTTSGKELRLAEGDTLKIVLASAGNTDAVNSFTAATFEISGTFQAYDTDAANDNFDEVVVAISGKLASGVTIANSNGSVASVTATTVSASDFAGTASADIAVGPQLIQSGDEVGTPVVETVTVEYPYTPAV